MKNSILLLGLGGSIFSSVAALGYGVLSQETNQHSNHNHEFEEECETITFKQYKKYIESNQNKEKILKNSIKSENIEINFNSKILNTLITGRNSYYSNAINKVLDQNSKDLTLKVNKHNSPTFSTPSNFDGFGNYYADRYNPVTGKRVIIQNNNTRQTYYNCDGKKVTSSMCNKHFSHPIWKDPVDPENPNLPKDWVFNTKAKASKVDLSFSGVATKEPGLQSDLRESIDGIDIYNYEIDSPYTTAQFNIKTGYKQEQKVGTNQDGPATITHSSITYEDTLVLQRSTKFKTGNTELTTGRGFIASFDQNQNMFNNLLVVDGTTSSYSNNGSFYFNNLGQNPEFKFGLNLSFVTASYELKNIYEQTKILLDLNENIINEYLNPSGETLESLFGSKENYYTFINTYIQNILDAKYSSEEISLIIKFFNDLATRKITKSQIDAILNNSSTQFPLLTESTIENWVEVLKDNGKELPKITNQNSSNDRVYFNSKLNSIMPVNLWNSLVDYIIPEFLNQTITAKVKINGVEQEFIAFDASKKEFNVLAIPLHASSVSTLEIISLKTESGKLMSSVDNVLSRSQKYQTIEVGQKAYLVKDNFENNLVVDNNNKFSWLYASEKTIINENRLYRWEKENKLSAKVHKPETRLIIPEEAYDGDAEERNMYASELGALMWFPQKYAHRAMGSLFMHEGADFSTWMRFEMPKYVNNDVSEAGAPVSKYLSLHTVFNNNWTDRNTNFEELTGNEIKERIANGEEILLESHRANNWFEFFTMPEFGDIPLKDFYANDYTGLIYVFGSFSPKINDANQDGLTRENGFYKVPNTETLGGAIVSYNYVVQLEVPKRKFKSNTEQEFINIFENVNKPNEQLMVNQEIYDETLRRWVDSIKPFINFAQDEYPESVLVQPEVIFNHMYDPNSIKVNEREMVIRFPKSVAALASVGANGEIVQIPFSLNDFNPFSAFKEKYQDLINEGRIIIDEEENTITWSSKLVEKMLGIQPYPFYVASNHINWDNLKYGYDFETGITITPEDIKIKIDSMNLKDKVDYLLTDNVLNSDKVDFVNSLKNVNIEIVEINGIISLQIRWIYKNEIIDRNLITKETQQENFLFLSTRELHRTPSRYSDITIIPPDWVMVEFKPWEEKLEINNTKESWDLFKEKFGKEEFYAKYFNFNPWAISEIRNIVFNDFNKTVSFELVLKKNFIPSIGYRDSWTLSNPELNRDTSTKFRNFEVQLTLVDPIPPIIPDAGRANWEVPVISTGISVGVLLVIGLFAFIIIRRHKQKKYLTSEIKVGK
ncbi:MAG: EGFR-like transmembrane domain-containing protein [Metamycoplasmataceae bacterium]